MLYYESQPGISKITFRGLSLNTQEENSTGNYLGELPLSSIAGTKHPNIRLVDIDRVEILKGPQGTLYGSNAMTGSCVASRSPRT